MTFADVDSVEVNRLIAALSICTRLTTITIHNCAAALRLASITQLLKSVTGPVTLVFNRYDDHEELAGELADIEAGHGLHTCLSLLKSPFSNIHRLEFCYHSVSTRQDASPLAFELDLLLAIPFLRGLSMLVLDPANVKHFVDFFEGLAHPGGPNPSCQLPLLTRLEIEDESVDESHWHRVFSATCSDSAQLVVQSLLPFFPNVNTVQFSAFITDPDTCDAFDFGDLPSSLRSAGINFHCHFIGWNRWQLDEFFESLALWLNDKEATHCLQSLSLEFDWEEIKDLVRDNEQDCYAERQYPITSGDLDLLLDKAQAQHDGIRYLRYPWDPKSEPLEHSLEAVGHLLDYATLVEVQVPKVMRRIGDQVQAIRDILASRGIAFRMELPLLDEQISSATGQIAVVPRTSTTSPLRQLKLCVLASFGSTKGAD